MTYCNLLQFTVFGRKHDAIYHFYLLTQTALNKAVNLWNSEHAQYLYFCYILSQESTDFINGKRGICYYHIFFLSPWTKRRHVLKGVEKAAIKASDDNANIYSKVFPTNLQKKQDATNFMRINYPWRREEILKLHWLRLDFGSSHIIWSDT